MNIDDIEKHYGYDSDLDTEDYNFGNSTFIRPEDLKQLAIKQIKIWQDEIEHYEYHKENAECECKENYHAHRILLYRAKIQALTEFMNLSEDDIRG